MVALLLSCSLVLSLVPPRPLSAQSWTVGAREHVDLWLHGYALVHDDSSVVPLYRRGYRAEVAAAKRSTSLVTDLDANAGKLGEGLAAMPALVGGQFLALEFPSWDEMRAAIRLLLDANGDLRRLRNQQEANRASIVAAYFPGARERDWLRLFIRGLDDEREKYFRERWIAEQRDRHAAAVAAEQVWHDSVVPSLRRYLGNSQQAGGTIMPSFVLEGEGRTIQRSRSANLIVTGLPASDTAAWHVAYVVAHEVVATVAAAAVRDHTTPAQQRSGEAEAYNALALVRGGALLLEKAMPDAVDGYMRFYLAAAGRPVEGDVRAAFAAAFALPEPMLAGIRSQIDVIWGGI